MPMGGRATRSTRGRANGGAIRETKREAACGWQSGRHCAEAEAEAEAASEVKAYMKLAGPHGHMITAAEAKERLRWGLEFVEQEEAKRWMGLVDAASPLRGSSIS